MGERVNYLCQRCQQPLRLDPSLLSLDEHTLAELSLPITPTPNHHQLVSQVFIYPSVLYTCPSVLYTCPSLAELSLPITPTPNYHQLVSQVFIYPSVLYTCPSLAELSLPITPTPNHQQLVSQVFIYPSRPSVLHMYLLVVGPRDPTVCTDRYGSV